MNRVTEEAFWDETYQSVAEDRVPADLRHLRLLYALEPWLYESQFLFAALGNVEGRCVLSVGGGVDGTALWMAQRGARVTCLDVSAEAVRSTTALATSLGLARRVDCHRGACETMTYRSAFDVVLCRKALHHMAVPGALAAIRAALNSSGVFLAHEPVCLSTWLAKVHDRLPFHPDYPVIAGERVLSADDLAHVSTVFPQVSIDYFGLVTRPSLAYFAERAGLKRLLRPLGVVDHRILRACPWLRAICASVVIKAVNDGP